MKIIDENPFRYLGVYSTSPMKERVANRTRLKAFMKVGKGIQFPLDLPQLLPTAKRTLEAVESAVAHLTLPQDQLRYAQFWFANVTEVDNIACAKLTEGNFDDAVDIWSKVDNVSSLQNRIVCSLIKRQYKQAINCAEKLYSRYSDEFVKMVIGDVTVPHEELSHHFLDVLREEVDIRAYLPYITITDWKVYVGSEVSQSLIDEISLAIDAAKGNRGSGSEKRLRAGEKLKDDTQDKLEQLRQYLSSNDLKYKMIADNVGLEVLRCSIDYYNGSTNEWEAVSKAKQLLSYAQSVVVGKAAKDRCKEDADSLDSIIAALPPKDVFTEYRTIQSRINTFADSKQTYEDCKALLFDSVCDLVTIKSIRGKSDFYYLKISSLLANVLLSFVIDRVSEQVSNDFQRRIKKNKEETLFNIMWTLRFSWNIIVNIDEMNTTEKFRKERLNGVMSKIITLIKELDYDFNDKADRHPNPFTYSPHHRISPFVTEFLKQFYSVWNKGKKIPEYTSFAALDATDAFLDNIDYSISNISNQYGYPGVLRQPPQISPRPRHPISLPGFMAEWIDDGIIDLRTEEENFQGCKEAFEKKSNFPHDASNYLYESYIKKFPNGNHVQEIKSFQSESDEEYKLFQQYNINIDSCNKYISNYSNRWYITEIKWRLDEYSFDKYQSSNDMLSYLHKFPHGNHAEEADDKYFESCDRILDWKRYIRELPQGKHVKEAKDEINAICKVIAICLFVLFIIW